MRWGYEKLNEDMKIEYLPTNDTDGKITGKIIMNLKAYFDENPEERIRLGWTKHISYTEEEIKEKVQYNPQTQYLIKYQKQIDEYTIVDAYNVIDKTEEMMLFEDMLALTWGTSINAVGNGIYFFE